MNRKVIKITFQIRRAIFIYLYFENSMQILEFIIIAKLLILYRKTICVLYLLIYFLLC